MPRLRRHALALGLLVVCAASGCGGDDDGDGAAPSTARQGSTTAKLERFVLAASDLPRGYEAEERRASSSPKTCLRIKGRPEVSRTLERKFTALGFKGCVGASFRKEVGDRVTRNNRPASLAILVRDEQAASDALPVMRQGLLDSFKTRGTAGGFVPHSVTARRLGDEAPRGMKFRGSLGPRIGEATFFIYVWRRGDVVIWMGSSDVLSDLGQRRTLELARKLDARGARRRAGSRPGGALACLACASSWPAARSATAVG